MKMPKSAKKKEGDSWVSNNSVLKVAPYLGTKDGKKVVQQISRKANDDETTKILWNYFDQLSTQKQIWILRHNKLCRG